MNYDYLVIGGGIAGLTFATLEAKKGKSVLVLEKNTYPKHKVCGEYVSNESLGFLKKLGLPLDELDLPQIQRVKITSKSGVSITSGLELGGFGISRYTFDNLLYKNAIKNGVNVIQNAYVKSVEGDTNNGFSCTTKDQNYLSKQVVGAFGKRANLDLDWQRPFTKDKSNTYLAIKHHIKTDFPKDLIQLFLFKNGYCGVSAIEENTYCLCYMAKQNSVDQGISDFEQRILSENKALKSILDNSDKLFTKPVSISQISFAKKETSYKGIPLLGDAAGMIAPLFGNGMSIALRSADLYSKSTDSTYYQAYKKEFANRLVLGRFLQNLLQKPLATDLVFRTLNYSPYLTKKIIKNTHGKPF